MATAIASPCSTTCPCASATAFSRPPAPSSLHDPSFFLRNNAGIVVSPKRKSTSRCASAGPCHRRRQQQNEEPISAPMCVPPALISTRRKEFLPCPRAELDSDTILAVSVGVVGLALGVGIPVFYETQVKGSEDRENDQPCFPCSGSGSQTCRFCVGAGNITVELGADEKEVSKCINCEGAGNITCTTCQGSGVQPRYLDRREYKDED